MATSGQAVITILDANGQAVVVPSTKTQVKIGCAASGTINQIVATTSKTVLSSTFVAGELPEAAGLAVDRGIVTLNMRIPTVTPGAVAGAASSKTVSAATNANPIVVTTTAPHGLETGDVVTIAGVAGNTAANGTFDVTVLSSTTFSIPVAGTAAYTSGGTVSFGGVLFAGTSEPTVTGVPLDEYYVEIKIVSGGTVGSAGIVFTVSLDAGRQSGPQLALGTATTYVIPGTGLTLNLAAGTLVAGDTIRFATTPPKGNVAGVLSALDALYASQYRVIGWGGATHILGRWSASDAASIQAKLDELAGKYVYTRGIIDAADTLLPTGWGGAGETESAWMTRIQNDFGTADAKRVACCAGSWNMQSAFANAAAGQPRFRRGLSWAFAIRTATVDSPQRHQGRVRDGALVGINIDAANDPVDGFVYHDEAVSPGLDNLSGGAGRFTTALTRSGLPGVYIMNPLTLAAQGSKYQLMPRGTVMDLACDIVHQTEQQNINDDLRVNPGKDDNDPVHGTIYENDAINIEQTCNHALDTQMTSNGIISAAKVLVDRTNDILDTGVVNTKISLTGKGYVLEEDISIGYGSGAAS